MWVSFRSSSEPRTEGSRRTLWLKTLEMPKRRLADRRRASGSSGWMTFSLSSVRRKGREGRGGRGQRLLTRSRTRCSWEGREDAPRLDDVAREELLPAQLADRRRAPRSDRGREPEDGEPALARGEDLGVVEHGRLVLLSAVGLARVRGREVRGWTRSARMWRGAETRRPIEATGRQVQGWKLRERGSSAVAEREQGARGGGRSATRTRPRRR